MHDVAKTSVSQTKVKSGFKAIIKSVLAVGGLVALVFVLKAFGFSVLTRVLVVFAVLAVGLSFMAVVRFRKGQNTAGAVCAVFALFCLLGTVKLTQFNRMASMPRTMPATAVMSTTVKEEDWPPILSAVGSLSATQGAVVSTELGGVVSNVNFQNGGEAKKGDVLLKLDASAEEGQLHTSEAELSLAEANVARTRDLAARKVVSKAELDAAESVLRQKRGSVENMRSMIAKKEVRAPFDGQIGIRQVNVGQSIEARQPVVALTALDPLFIDFTLPQQDLARLTGGLEVLVRTDAVPGRTFTGKLTAINSMVDPITRNVPLQATLDNHDHALRPGMFAKVEVILPQKQKTLVAPGSSISYAPFGDSVFVIEKKKDPKTGTETQTIKQVFVKLGEARGDFIAVTEGLKPGDTIVSAGVFKLRSGMPVTINNDLAPKPQVNPTPADS